MDFLTGILKQSAVVQWIVHRPEGRSLLAGSGIRLWLSHIPRPHFHIPVTVLSRGRWLAEYLLCVLLFAGMFIPRIYVGSLDLSRIDLRPEDYFLALLCAIALPILMGIEGKGSGVPSVEKAFIAFLVAAEISIIWGIGLRTIDKPLVSILYILKWLEYFLIFWITVRLADTERTSRLFLRVFCLLGLAAACYGYWEHFFPLSKAVYPNYYRLFERFPFQGDANHLGGFFVIWIGFFLGFFLKSSNRRDSALALLGLIFVFFPLLWTYSRKSYFALAGVLFFALIFLKERRKVLLVICLFVLLALLLPTRMAERLMDLGEALTSTDEFHSSWAGNWIMWTRVMWNFSQFFLFGSGLGSRHRLYYESQYVLILAETGMVGLTVFVYLWISLIRQFLIVPYRGLDPRTQAMALGWFLGFAGLVIHSASCVSWTVAKVAIPFWFLTGTVLACLRMAPARRAP